MMKRSIFFAASFLVLTLFFSGCGQTSPGMQNGYYSAEAAVYDEFGWKEFVTIYVSDGRIITVEYDAFNPSGFVKSWDINYMRAMKMECGTYPNEYARAYSISLINWQRSDGVDAMTGATHSHSSFQKLAEAAISKSIAGDKRVALVEF